MKPTELVGVTLVASGVAALACAQGPADDAALTWLHGRFRALPTIGRECACLAAVRVARDGRGLAEASQAADRVIEILARFAAAAVYVSASKRWLQRRGK